MPRPDRVCSHCAGRCVADKMHVVFECHALQPLRQQYAPLFRLTPTLEILFGQKDYMQVFRFVLDCLDFLHIYQRPIFTRAILVLMFQDCWGPRTQPRDQTFG